MANNQQNYGYPVPFTQSFPAPIASARSPATSDIEYPLGQVWVNKTTNNAYILVDVTAASATWKIMT